MRETPEDLDDLQRLLDASHAGSGEYLTGIIGPQRLLTARQITAALTGIRVLVVATVTADGRPRTSCVDGHFLRGRWTFATAGNAVKARHLRARPAVSATHADGERMAVFTHGTARRVEPGDPQFAALDEHFTSHYGSSPRDWTPDPVFIEIDPTWMVGYAANPTTYPAHV